MKTILITGIGGLTPRSIAKVVKKKFILIIDSSDVI